MRDHHPEGPALIISFNDRSASGVNVLVQVVGIVGMLRVHEGFQLFARIAKRNV